MDEKTHYPEDVVMAVFLTIVALVVIAAWIAAMITAPVITAVISFSAFIVGAKIYPFILKKLEETD